MVRIGDASVVPGGVVPSGYTDIVESHDVQAPKGSTYGIQNTFEGNCSTVVRIFSCLAVPLWIIPNIRRAAFHGRWQFTAKPVGTESIDEVRKILTITPTDTLAQLHILKNKIDSETDWSENTLNSYIHELSKLGGYYSIHCKLIPKVVQKSREKNFQFTKKSASEKFFITYARPEILKEYMLKLKNENQENAAREFAEKCRFRFGVEPTGGYSSFSSTSYRDYNDWLLQNGLS